MTEALERLTNDVENVNEALKKLEERINSLEERKLEERIESLENRVEFPRRD